MSTHLNGLSGKLVGRALRPCGAAVRISARYSARRVARQTAQPQQNRRRQTDAVATATMADEKPKEGVKTENNEHINLKVAGQDGSVVQFKIKRHTPLSKLMKAYCERQGLSMRQIRFRFDGQPINETDTPSQLEMEDEDTIDVFQQQTGGSFLS
uniref:Ubiquitin-like domain-containing protein n=4 Tax=Euacanthomorphacea TaxID=123369 RepID=A0AAQ4Q297_GASAC